MLSKGRAIAIIAIFLMAAIALPLSLPASDLTMGAAIDKAGRQRMLTQRIVKAYCQIGMDVMSEQARKQLRHSVDTFSRQLEQLRSFAPNGMTAEGLVKVDGIWREFKARATGPVTRESATELASLGEDLLHASHRVVQILQDTSGTSYARLVNISGRQRMLSQRLAKYHLMRQWGLDSITIRDEIQRAANEFNGGLDILRTAPENSSQISAEIEKVQLQWQWFRTALNLGDAESSAQVVAEASESILMGMEQITRMYAELSSI